MNAVFLQGFLLCAGLIMVIGAQNAHVLRIGLLRQQVLVTVSICIVLDGLLIALGVMGMGKLIESSPILLELTRWGGVAFLSLYGLRSWQQALRPQVLANNHESAPTLSLQRALLTILAMTLLNPHVYLDTVVLIGSVGGQHEYELRGWFIAGAWLASIIWFISLGYGARLLEPWFRKPRAWQVLDAIIGCIMLLLAGKLALG